MVAGNGAGLVDAIQANDARLVVLDLAEISAVDAAGLGSLVALHLWARAAGRRLKLLNVTSSVESLLRLTKLCGVFEVCSVTEMLDLICGAADPFSSHGSWRQNHSDDVYPSGGPIAGEKFRTGVSIVEFSNVV